MDMGFGREHCIEALSHTNSLEQALEYILNHPPPPAPAAAVETQEAPNEAEAQANQLAQV